MASKLKIAAATQSLWDYSLMEGVDIIAECGFDGIEIVVLEPWLPLAEIESQRTELADRIRQRGLEVVSLTTITNFTDSDKAADNTAYVKSLIDLSEVLGTNIIKIAPGPPASAQAGQKLWDAIPTNLAGAVKYAEQKGRKLAVETHLNMVTDNIAGTERFLSLFDSPAVGLTLDFCNVMVGHDDAVEAVKRFADRTFLCHVKDGLLKDDGTPEWLPLGEGVLDYPGILSDLVASSYQGFLSLECLVKDHRYHPGRLQELGGPKGVLQHDREALLGLLSDAQRG